jgi:hypothetical protein
MLTGKAAPLDLSGSLVSSSVEMVDLANHIKMHYSKMLQDHQILLALRQTRFAYRHSTGITKVQLDASFPTGMTAIVVVVR